MSAYEKDLFISYAHIDNQPLKDDQSGWISRFHSSLESLLSMRLGAKVNIWRDDKLQGNDQFAEQITEQFNSTAALISVVSPRYVKSDWCAREVSAFCDQADQSNDLVIKHKARIFKVIKSPVDSEDPLPEIMKELLGYEFYQVEDGVPVEMDEFFGLQYGRDFNLMLNKLAFEIAILLTDIKEAYGSNAGTSSESNTKPSVYLAECSFDMKQHREMLGAELRRLGHRVFPERQLPRTESDYVIEVEKLLVQCQLSVHLIGEQYGVVPDGPNDKSTSTLQNEVAARCSESNGLKRVVWIKEGIESEQKRQINFIESLQSDPQAQRGADLIIGRFEDLRTATEAAISLIERERCKEDQPTSNSIEGESEKCIHIVFTEQDRKATLSLRKYCRRNGFNVTLPAFEGDAAKVRSINQDQMASADIVMIYYGTGDEAWKRSVDTEIRKLQGYRASTNTQSSFTYLASPTTSDKDDLVDMDEPDIINALEGYDEASLNVWLQSIGNEPVSV